MSQSLSRRSFLKCAGSGAVSLAAALLTGVSAAALAPCYQGEPALLDGKAAVELLGYAPAQEMGNVLVYLSVENLSASTLPVGASYLQSREVCTLGDLYSMGTGVTAVCDGKPVRCGSFAAPLYGENAADASVFTLNLTAGRGALLHLRQCLVARAHQLLLVAGGASAHEVADTGAEVLQEVDAGDHLAEHDAVVAGDTVALHGGGGGDDHGGVLSWVGAWVGVTIPIRQ